MFFFLGCSQGLVRTPQSSRWFQRSQPVLGVPRRWREGCYFARAIFFKVKSYCTTDRSHLGSEWIHFQPFKNRRRAESSEPYPKHSKEVQATLHGTPLLQCTQITNRDPNTHIQRGKCINETMSFQPESFTVPNQVVHYHIISCTHTHTQIRSSKIQNLPRCDRTEQFIFSFWPSNHGRSVTSGMGEPTSIRGVPFCLPCLHQRWSGQTLKIARR
jgi:hypothetical protein